MKHLTILANLIEDWVAKSPDLDVLTFVSVGDSGELLEEKRSYRELWENGQRLAVMLQNKRMKKGDSFGLVMANHPEFVEMMIASSILGTIFVPIDPRTHGEKLRFMLEFAECRGAVVADYAVDNVRKAWEGNGGWLLPMGSSSEGESVQSALKEPLPNPMLQVESDDPEAPMQMLYTSGTTGDPKAIISPHSRFAVGAAAGDMIGITSEGQALHRALFNSCQCTVSDAGVHSGKRAARRDKPRVH